MPSEYGSWMPACLTCPQVCGLELGLKRETSSASHMCSAGTEAEDHFDSDQKALGVMGLVQRDTSLFLRDLRLGASSWLNSFLELSGRKPQKTTLPTAGELELAPRHLSQDSIDRHLDIA